MSENDRSGLPDDAIILDCDLDQPPQTVWRALTEPALLERWLMASDFRPEPGRRFAFEGGPDEGGAIDGEVLAVEPGRMLRYSWRGGDESRDAAGRPLDTIVTFELSATPAGGTHLRIVHSGFASAPGQPMTMLAVAARALRGALAACDPPPRRDVRPIELRTASALRKVMPSGLRRAA